MKILWIMGLYCDRSEYIATKLASGYSCNWVDSEQIMTDWLFYESDCMLVMSGQAL